jgi:2-aminoethylphosphonate-pyruvate transaminase
MPDRTCLLNPGPVNLTFRVRQALLGPDLCHREREFGELQEDVRERLSRVYPRAGESYTTVLLTGSGTSAVEAMVGSLVPRGGKALVAANGVYGERMASILRTQGKSLEVVRSGWTEPIDLERVSAALRQNPAFTHVVAVHHETTTGRLNDLAALGVICRDRGVPLLLDAVSSFGGEPIDFENWNIEACAATANKCLHAVPGISFVLVRKDAIQTGQSNASTLYLDLFGNYRAQRAGSTLFTPAVQTLYALQEALVEFEESGGWECRNAHYQRLSRRIRTGLRRQGFPLLLKDERVYSSVLSSFELPEGLDYAHLHAHARDAGFVIYSGQQSLEDAIFRVAVMGDLTERDVETFLASMETLVCCS